MGVPARAASAETRVPNPATPAATLVHPASRGVPASLGEGCREPGRPDVGGLLDPALPRGRTSSSWQTPYPVSRETRPPSSSARPERSYHRER